MTWKTDDYVCPNCGEHITHMYRRDEGRPAEVECSGCGGTAHYTPHFTPLKASYPDGNRRFQHIREDRALEREQRKARKRGDAKGVAQVLAERLKAKGKK